MVTDGSRALFRLPQWSPDFLRGLMIPVRRRPLFFSMQEEATTPPPSPPTDSGIVSTQESSPNSCFPLLCPPPLLLQSYNWFIMFSRASCPRSQQPRPRANVHIWYWPQVTRARQARGIINTPSPSRCRAPAFVLPFVPVFGFAAFDR